MLTVVNEGFFFNIHSARVCKVVLIDGRCEKRYKNDMEMVLDLPEIGEPFDELGRVVLVEFDVGEVHLEHRRTRIAHPEEHQLGFAEMHRSQG